MIPDEIDEIIKLYTPDGQDEILRHLIGVFWTQVIDKHVEIYRDTLTSMQVDVDPHLFLQNYLEVKTKLNFWLDFRNYVNSLKR